MRHPAGLRLVSDDYGRGLRLGALRVRAAPAHRPPFAVQAEVCEEDTFLVLSASPELEEPEADLGTLARALERWQAPTPGNVVVRPGQPLRLLAVVHDLDREPSWCEAWIEAATRTALGEADRRGLAAVAVPLLGCRHGQLDPLRYPVLLARACAGLELRHVGALWLVCPEGSERRLCAVLREASGAASAAVGW